MEGRTSRVRGLKDLTLLGSQFYPKWSRDSYNPYQNPNNSLFLQNKTKQNLILKYIRNLQGPQFSSVQSLSRVQLFATPWITARQASLSITNSQSSLKLMSIESVMAFSHLILCHPLLLISVFPSIRVFSNELALHIRWPKHWSFSFRIHPSIEYSVLISFQTDWFNLLIVQETHKSLLQHHSLKASLLQC